MTWPERYAWYLLKPGVPSDQTIPLAITDRRVLNIIANAAASGFTVHRLSQEADLANENAVHGLLLELELEGFGLRMLSDVVEKLVVLRVDTAQPRV